MLAIGIMSPTATAIFYIAAVVLFVLGGLGQAIFGKALNLVGLGLAAYVFVQAWNAVAAT